MKPFLAMLALVATLDAMPTPQPTATPDWHVYNDPAMHFRAPDGFFPIGQRHVAVGDLTEDQATTVAGWIYPLKDHVRRLVIQQEYYDGDVSGFDSVLESQMRDQFQDAFFKNKEHTTLKNGMPAMFVDMSSGEGFNIQKVFMLIWADGQRGVVVSVACALGDLDTNAARALLTDATAVRYPIGR